MQVGTLNQWKKMKNGGKIKRTNKATLVSFSFQGQTIDDIPPEVLIDCAQLVKNNSIQGNDQQQQAVSKQPFCLDFITPHEIVSTNNASSLLHL